MDVLLRTHMHEQREQMSRRAALRPNHWLVGQLRPGAKHFPIGYANGMRIDEKRTCRGRYFPSVFAAAPRGKATRAKHDKQAIPAAADERNECLWTPGAQL